MNKEPLSVNNICKTIAKIETFSGQWIKVAELLKVNRDIVDSILVSRLTDTTSLRKVVEWWFMNTANPEWSAIEKICKLL